MGPGLHDTTRTPMRSLRARQAPRRRHCCQGSRQLTVERIATLLILALALTFAAPSRAAAADAENEEPRLRALLDRLPVVEKDYLAKAKYAGHYTPSSLVGFYNHQGRLFAVFHLPPQLVKQF